MITALTGGITVRMRIVAAVVLVTACRSGSGAATEPAKPAAPPPSAEAPARPEPAAPPPTALPAQPADGSGTTVSAGGDANGSGSDATEAGTAPVAEHPAGGAVGWGSIGSGRYAKIGHGSGTCCASGQNPRPRTRAIATMSMGQPVTDPGGVLDKAIIRRYIKRNLEKLEACYQNAIAKRPGLAGTVTTKFTIGAAGNVTKSSASGVDPQVESCVARTIQAIEFPRFREGVQVDSVDVVYPFTFRS